MKKLKKILYDALILVLPVMLGVYLGLLANNWNENRKENVLSEKILSNLAREVDYNSKVIDSSLQYFTQLRDSVQYYIQNNAEVNPSSFSFWQGLNPPLLRNSSYQAGVITGILTKVNIELLEQLSTTYGLQQDLKEQSSIYVTSVTNKIGSGNFTDQMYLIILQNYAFDQAVIEKQLQMELQKTRKLLKQGNRMR